MADTDDRRRRRCEEPRRNGTGDHLVQLCASGCWCRREDSNLHGVTHPTRSLAWRVSLSRPEPVQPHDTPVTSVHLHATGSENPFWSRVPSGCPESLPHHASGFHWMHVGALPCQMSDTDDRRHRRCGQTRRNGTGDHPVQFYASGCWCRREDSNLHGAINPTRSLAWRVFQFRHSDECGAGRVYR